VIESDVWLTELCHRQLTTLSDVQGHLAILSENKCSLLFRSLIESPGDLTADDIASELLLSDLFYKNGGISETVQDGHIVAIVYFFLFVPCGGHTVTTRQLFTAR